MNATPYQHLAVALADVVRLIGKLPDPADREIYADRLRETLRRSAAANGLSPEATELLVSLILEVALRAADPTEPEHQPTEQRTVH